MSFQETKKALGMSENLTSRAFSAAKIPNIDVARRQPFTKATLKGGSSEPEESQH